MTARNGIVNRSARIVDINMVEKEIEWTTHSVTGKISVLAMKIGKLPDITFDTSESTWGGAVGNLHEMTAAFVIVTQPTSNFGSNIEFVTSASGTFVKSIDQAAETLIIFPRRWF